MRCRKYSFEWEVNYSHQGSLLLWSILLSMSFSCSLLSFCPYSPPHFCPSILQLCYLWIWPPPGAAGSWEDSAGWRAWAAALLQPCSKCCLAAHPASCSHWHCQFHQKPPTESSGIIQSQTCFFTAAPSWQVVYAPERNLSICYTSLR